MNTKCAICSNEISNIHNIYRGFDCSFCSTYCRTKMWTKIYQEDSNFNNPDLWSNKSNKFKKLVKWDENIPKKNTKQTNISETNISETNISETEISKISADSVINYNISDHIPNDKYYNCNYSIYDMLPIKYFTNYLLETVESSYNLLSIKIFSTNII